MGGERETSVPASKGTTTPTSVNNIRVHESQGEVHFHDDSAKLKAAVPVAVWWKAWEQLRTEPTPWVWYDPVNGTELRIEPASRGTHTMEYEVTLHAATFGPVFTALSSFTKGK